MRMWGSHMGMTLVYVCEQVQHSLIHGQTEEPT